MPPSPAPSRRAVVGGLAAAAAALALGGCGIRLEDDAPRLPLVPTRQPAPGEALLTSFWLESLGLAGTAAAAGGAATGLPAVLVAVHRDQAKVLHDALSRLGVPARTLEEATRQQAERPATGTSTTSVAPPPPSPTTTATGTPATGTPAASTPATSTPATSTPATSTPGAALGSAEAAALTPERQAQIGGLLNDLVPMAASLLAQRGAAANLLGQRVTWAGSEWADAAALAPFLAATRSAVYGFEVVAAQAGSARQALSARTLATLRGRAQQQEELSGPGAAPPPLGYPLPFAVTTPAAADRLATHLLTGLRLALGSAVATLVPAPAALPQAVSWLAEAEVLAHRWGLPLEPFPGLE